eukprot:732389_1
MFVSKVFRSKDYNSFLWVLQQLFRKVTASKPQSSRTTSAEIFLVCEDYRAPASIDPRLLDPSFVFRDVTEVKESENVLTRKAKKKPSRQGYEDGLSLIRKEGTVSAFIESEKPQEFLAEFTLLDFDKAASEHFPASDEIKRLFADLQVLGKADFKALLKWRLKLLKSRRPAPETPADEEEPAPEEVDLEEAYLAREKDLLAKLDRDALKRKRKKHTAKMKQLGRMMGSGAGELDSDQEESLFSLKAIKSAQDLKKVDGGDAEGDLDSDSDDLIESGDDSDNLSSSDDEIDQSAYIDEQEAAMDEMYERFKERKNLLTRQKLGLGSDDELPSGDEGQANDNDREELFSDDGKGALIVDFDEDKAADPAERWFSGEAFKDLAKRTENAKKDVSEPTCGDEEPSPKRRKLSEKTEKASEQSPVKGVRSSAGENSDSEHLSYRKSRALARQKRSNRAHERRLEHESKGAVEVEEFEVVPLEEDFSSDSDAAAEVLAMGKAMLRKRRREEIVNASFNRPIKKIAEAQARKKWRKLQTLEKLKGESNAIAANQSMSNKEKMSALRRLHGKKLKKKKLEKFYVVNTKSGAKNKGARKPTGSRLKLVDKRMKADSRGMRASKRKGGKGGGRKKSKSFRRKK